MLLRSQYLDRVDEMRVVCVSMQAPAKNHPQILHLYRFFAREITFGILFKRNSAAGATEVVEVALVCCDSASGVAGVDAHAADGIGCGLIF
jgi:hypothetical protein